MLFQPIFQHRTRILAGLFLAATLIMAASPALARPAAKDPTPALAFGETSYQRLGERFADLLSDMDWADGTVSILVQDADVPVKVFGLNEATPMEPGGIIQIATAAAALNRLGPDFRFTTTLGISGSVVKHELAGSVVIRGDGDPTLSALFLKDPLDDGYDQLDRWAKLIRKQKIRKITGTIIGDDRAFDGEWQAPGWPLARLGDPDLPSVSALNFNHNCVDIFWQKTKKIGASAECEIFPNLPKYVFLANKVKIEANAPLARQYSRERDSNVLAITGSLSPKTEAHDRAAIEDPARFFAETLKERLISEYDVEVPGAAVSANKLSPAEIPQNVQVLGTIQSPPLVQILSDMMRYDLTLNAEVVFKTLGCKAGAKQGSFAAGADAVRAFIDDLHLPGSVWSFADGSGRSRIDRISPAQLLGLMRSMARQERGREFALLFPRAWEEGTLKDRFKPLKIELPQTLDGEDAGKDQQDKAAADKKAGEEEKEKKKKELELARQRAKEAEKEEAKESKTAPQIWAKSGSAEGAESLAGYVNTRFGRRLAFAIMVNGSRLPREVLRAQIDALVLRLTE